jgi:hypothetical protein
MQSRWFPAKPLFDSDTLTLEVRGNCNHAAVML